MPLLASHEPRLEGQLRASPTLLYLLVSSYQQDMKRVKISNLITTHRRYHIRTLTRSLRCSPTTETARPPFLQKRPSSSFHSLTMADHPTLVKPPPVDPSKSAIENVLELTELGAIGPVSSSLIPLFTEGY